MIIIVLILFFELIACYSELLIYPEKSSIVEGSSIKINFLLDSSPNENLRISCSCSQLCPFNFEGSVVYSRENWNEKQQIQLIWNQGSGLFQLEELISCTSYFQNNTINNIDNFPISLQALVKPRIIAEPLVIFMNKDFPLSTAYLRLSTKPIGNIIVQVEKTVNVTAMDPVVVFNKTNYNFNYPVSFLFSHSINSEIVYKVITSDSDPLYSNQKISIFIENMLTNNIFWEIISGIIYFSIPNRNDKAIHVSCNIKSETEDLNFDFNIEEYYSENITNIPSDFYLNCHSSLDDTRVEFNPKLPFHYSLSLEKEQVDEGTITFSPSKLVLKPNTESNYSILIQTEKKEIIRISSRSSGVEIRPRQIEFTPNKDRYQISLILSDTIKDEVIVVEHESLDKKKYKSLNIYVNYPLEILSTRKDIYFNLKETNYAIRLSRDPLQPIVVKLSCDCYNISPNLIEFNSTNYQVNQTIFVSSNEFTNLNQHIISHEFVLENILTNFIYKPLSVYIHPLLSIFKIKDIPNVIYSNANKWIEYNITTSHIVTLDIFSDCKEIEFITFNNINSVYFIKFYISEVSENKVCFIKHNWYNVKENLLQSIISLSIEPQNPIVIDPLEITLFPDEIASYFLTYFSILNNSVSVMVKFDDIYFLNNTVLNIEANKQKIMYFHTKYPGLYHIHHTSIFGVTTLVVRVLSSPNLEFYNNNTLIQPGQSGNYQIFLKYQPNAPVDLTLSTSDPSLKLDSYDYKIDQTNWDKPINIKYSISPDAKGDESFQVYHQLRSLSTVIPVFPSTYSIYVRDSIENTINCVYRCPTGQESIPTSPFCSKCPINHYCPGNCHSAIKCPPGKTSPMNSATLSDCSVCQSGYFLPENQKICIPCPAGMKCTETEAVPCDKGEYGLLGKCNTCPHGTYSDTTGSKACTQCKPGYNCESPKITYQCPLGSFSEDYQCIPCPAGKSCINPQDYPTPCPTGTYSFESWPFCISCPSNHACILPQMPPLVCPIGTESIAGSSSCTSCKPGFKYETAGLSCTACALTEICIGGSSPPQRCIDGSYASGNICTACQMGTYLDGNTCKDCQAGFYCPHPSSSPIVCPSNYYSSIKSTFCMTCADGMKVNSAKTGCEDCTKGYLCQPGTDSIKCSAGTYTKDNSGCKLCPINHQCSDPTQNPVLCPSNKYSYIGSSQCSNCPLGHECSQSELPKPCGYGKYSTTSGCAPCPAGSSCTKTSATVCASGYYSLENDPLCHICPMGSFCPNQISLPTKCPDKHYSNFGAISCTPCDGPCTDGILNSKCPPSTFGEKCEMCSAGKYCDDGKTEKDCPENTISYEGQTECTPIPGGYYLQSNPKIWDNITPCSTGQYSKEGENNCNNCPAGHYCPSPTLDIQIKCPLGFYSPQNSLQCLKCPAGHFCDSTVTDSPKICTAGTYSIEGQIDCIKCPVGSYCPEDKSNTHFTCPYGTLTSTVGQKSCTSCPEGNYCSQSAILGACSGRSYSPLGTPICLSCPKGYTCTGSTVTKCAIGQYTDSTTVACLDCTAGYFCPDPEKNPIPCLQGTTSVAGSSECTLCPGGNFCLNNAIVKCAAGCYSPGGIITSCFPCTPGYDCAAEATNPTPVKCPIGSYCQLTSTNQCTVKTACPAGTISYETGGSNLEETCFPCPEGYTCAGNTVTICPTGSYCSKNTRFLCPLGTFQNSQGKTQLSDCQICAAGQTTATTGSTICTDCLAGFYCPYNKNPVPCPAGTYQTLTGGTSINSCSKCRKGRYCPLNSNVETLCPMGTYNSMEGGTGLESCILCPKGRMCNTAGMDGTVFQECRPGNYCPLGSYFNTETDKRIFPCPAGTFSTSTSLTHASECTICPVEKACSSGTSSITDMADCAGGCYCPEGTTDPQEYKCPPATYSNTIISSISQCLDCTAGNYCPIGSTTQIECPQGFYCPQKTGNKDEYPCPAGTFNNKLSLTSEAGCQDCPKGNFCIRGSVSPVPCPEGTYSTVTKTEAYGPAVLGTKTCLLCPAGYRCRSATIDPEICGIGTYSILGSSDCFPCLKSYYCPNEGLTESSMKQYPCPAGFLCGPGLTDFNLAAKCSKGKYCLQNSLNEIPCPAGTYLDIEGGKSLADCKKTPAGQYSNEGSENPTGDCSSGYYCPESSTSSTEKPCPSGTYNPSPASTSIDACISCPQSKYCPTGSNTPLSCRAGYFCPLNSSLPEPCPIGTFSPSTDLFQSEQCTPCTKGMYCDRLGLTAPAGSCSPGFICILGSPTSDPVNSTYGHICPKGGYCHEKSFELTACKPGKYNNVTGAEIPEDCIDCPPGYFCEGTNNTKPSDECSPGYYCTGGAENATQFPSRPGYYSEKGAIGDSPCKLGTFNDLPAQSVCKECPEGEYCDKMGMDKGKPCPLGFYCPKGSVMPTRCPRGTYAPISGVSSNVCATCLAGKYCVGSYGGSAIDLTLPTGDCYEGYYCILGAGYPNPRDGITGDICPQGHYCTIGISEPIKCPIGTFTGSLGNTKLDDCLQCSPGSYCDSEGSSEPKGECSAGYYCKSGSSMAEPTGDGTGRFGICPSGYSCPIGTSEPIACSPGSYTDSEGNSVCKVCEEGFYCSGSPTLPKEPCPKGFYCLLGTGLDYIPCPPGRYSDKTGLSEMEECTLCPAGYCCPQPGMTSHGGSCEAGYFCGEGSTDSKGTLSGGSPRLCIPGFYCPSGSTEPKPCPKGTYTARYGLKSMNDCELCDAGYYCAELNASTPTGPCDEGYYCQRNNTSPTPSNVVTNSDGIITGGEKCPKGTYCPEGSTSAKFCEAGTYNDEEGKPSCKDCTAGHYCTEGAQTLTGNCPIGYYCPPRTSYDKSYPCPAGTYNPVTNLESENSCTICDPGKYCDGTTLIAVTGNCAEGYYCSSGAKTAKPLDGITGDLCELGKYCPEGSTEAKNCKPGYYCAQFSPEKKCAPGYYCIEGSYLPNPTDGTRGDICTEGHYCPEGSSAPLKCSEGSYNPGKGNSDSGCTKCVPGFFCDEEKIITPYKQCTAGFYCEEGTITPTNKCPTGAYCPLGSSTPILCESGTYQDLEGQESCNTCEEGFYCLFGSKNMIECPVGHYCPPETKYATEFPCPIGTYNSEKGRKRIDECKYCPGGKYCPNHGMSDLSSFDCSAGFYCKENTTLKYPNTNIDPASPGYDGNECPFGNYCPKGTETPLKCPVGTYLPSKRSKSNADCIPCIPGYQCNTEGLEFPTEKCSEKYSCPSGSQAANQIPCPAGSYCPVGTIEPLKCPAGSYSNDLSKVCLSCPAGFYCEEGSSSLVIKSCPKGFYCPENTTHATSYSCPKGTYNSEIEITSISECKQCQAGYACPFIGMTEGNLYQCSKGYYCKTGSDTKEPISLLFEDAFTATSGGGICPPGFYCEQGTIIPQPCPSGKYSPSSGLTRVEDCLACPNGYECTNKNLTTLTTKCQEGYFCPNNASITKAICPIGSYCPEGSSNPLICPMGTYSDVEGNKECSKCKEGYFCPQGTTDYLLNICPAGYYCLDGTMKSDQFPCPIGSYSTTTGLKVESSCSPCTSGHYCPEPGQSTLPGGTLECENGFYCLLGSDTSQPIDGTHGNYCTKGHYCPKGTSNPIPCPIGTYSKAIGLKMVSECMPCTAGYVCSTEALVDFETTLCPPGYFCGPKTITATEECPINHYCPLGSSVPTPCLDGYYQKSTKSIECKDKCEEGFYCISGNSPVICPVGHYCPLGTKFSTQFPCPSGTYNTETSKKTLDDCKLCTDGYYCPDKGSSVLPSLKCHAGYFCKQGVKTPTPTDSITIADIKGGSICPAGYYCIEGTSTPVSCPLGTYSGSLGNKELSSCLSCPSGFTCNSLNLIKVVDLCPENYYCQGGNTVNPSDITKNPKQCTKGHFCPKGVDRPIPCVDGMYQNEIGKNQCMDCPAGFYCNEGCETPVLCPEGYYCPQLTGVNGKLYLCPEGTYSGTKGLKTADECIQCDTGSYCQGIGLINPSGKCKAGYYCNNSANYPTPIDRGELCPKGYYCPENTIILNKCPINKYGPGFGYMIAGECLACRSGMECDIEGLVNPIKKCQEGFYCKDGNKELCEANHFCPESSKTSDLCPPGKYQPTAGQTDCLPCPSGSYCNLGIENPCPKGYYCLEGQSSGFTNPCPPGTYGTSTGYLSESDCLPCENGDYCNTYGSETVTGKCMDGYICESKATLENQQSLLCPIGYYCKEGKKIGCPAGTYSSSLGNKKSSDCLSCPPGYICEIIALSNLDHAKKCPPGKYCQSNTEIECPIGNYCPEGSKAPLLCENGYISAKSQSTCSLCPKGSFCTFGVENDCPSGYFCPEGTSRQYENPCPIGTFNPNRKSESISACLSCTAGNFCEQPGLSDVSGKCKAGYYCRGLVQIPAPTDNGITVSSVSGGTYCPEGHYCVEGTSVPTKCPMQTFSLTISATKKEDCIECLNGYLCNKEGIGSISDLLPCPSGNFCKSGVQNQCTKGHYCTEGAAEPYPCLPGTYQPNTGQIVCLECEAGKYCEMKSEIGLECIPGFACPLGTKHKNQYPCPIGSFSSNRGITTLDDCTPCTAGSYCATSGLSTPTGLCTSGYYCPEGSSSPNLKDTECPPGNYCPQGSTEPIKCPNKTFSINTMNSLVIDCQPCTPGYYCNETGLVNPYPCPNGYYCPKDPLYDKVICPKGSYCLEGSATHLLCTAGTYQDEEGKTSCKVCPEGRSCMEGSINPQPCPKGYYCPLGTPHKHQHPCPIGTYSNTENIQLLSSCIDCPENKYCDSFGLTAPTGDCKGGYYCIGGSDTSTPIDDIMGSVCQPGYYCTGNAPPTKCPRNTYSITKGNTKADDCLPCLSGFICEEGTESPSILCPESFYCEDGIQINCPVNNYCPEGSAFPRICPPGFYQDQELQKECKSCPAGKYCNMEASPQNCPKGYYCPTGTSSKYTYPCPSGTFSNKEGLKDSLECTKCTSGKFCSVPGQTVESGDCSPGYYCLSGSTLPNPQNDDEGGLCQAGCYCPAGSASVCPSGCPIKKYCPEGTILPLDCPPGYYSPKVDLSSCMNCPQGKICPGGVEPIDCPENYYCNGQKDLVTGTLCPNGTYSDITGLNDPSQCKDCPAGKYCTNGRITGNCSAGYICGKNSYYPLPDSDTNTNSAVNHPCEVGRYCPEGTTDQMECPEGTYIAITHGKSAADCSSCPNGYVCEGTTASLCPPGSYCSNLFGAANQTQCPPFTYNDIMQKVYNTSCKPCPDGYYCNDYGISELIKYKCPEGFYCLYGETSPEMCPDGTFSDERGTTSQILCKNCTSGYYCTKGSINPIACPEKHYCREGSHEPLPCQEGFFCPALSSEPIKCTPGYYCPEFVSDPILCVNGTYCPEGTAVPFVCPLGSYAKDLNAQGLTDVDSACVFCPPGTYGTALDRYKCYDCTEGYACFGGTTSSFPIDADRDKGILCPQGHYCPSGTAVPKECPTGTFNENFGSISVDNCISCPSGYYNPRKGQIGCLICPSSATSGIGSQSCYCIGAFRSLSSDDGNCICIPGYEYYVNFIRQDGDGFEDCQPIVYERCPDNMVRSHMGKCISEDELCKQECVSGGGVFNERVGFCDCNYVSNINQICNADCRSKLEITTINEKTNMIEIRYANNTVKEIIDPKNISNAFSSLKCNISDDQNIGRGCVLTNIIIDNGNFYGNYQPSAALTKPIARNLQAEMLLSLPVLCLRKYDGVIFDLKEAGIYPKYLKDSLINTNPLYDSGPYRKLESLFRSNTTTSTFIYTFTEPGVYVFGLNTNEYKELIISVQDETALCPTEKLVTRTTPNLIVLSVQPETNLQLSTNWMLLLLSFLLVLFSIFFLLFGIYHIKQEIWKENMLKTIFYKEEGKRLQVDQTSDGQIIPKDVSDVAGMLVSRTIATINQFDPNRMIISTEDTESMKDLISKHDKDITESLEKKDKLIDSIMNIIKQQMITIKQVIKDSVLENKEDKKDYQALLDILGKEEESRMLFGKRILNFEDKIFEELDAFSKFPVHSENNTITTIFNEYREKILNGGPAKDSETLKDYKDLIQNLQNQIHRTEEFVAAEMQRREIPDMVYNELNTCNLCPEALDSVNRLKRKGDVEKEKGKEWAKKLTDQDNNLLIIMKRIQNIENEMNKTYSKLSPEECDENELRKIEEIYRRDLLKALEDLEKQRQDISHISLPLEFSEKKQQNERKKEINKIQKFMNNNNILNKAREVKDIQLNIRELDTNKLNVIHEEEKMKLKEEIAKDEENIIEELKIQLNKEVEETKIKDQKDLENRKVELMKEMDPEMSDALKNKLFNEMELDNDRYNEERELEQKKQEEGLKNRILERKQRKQKQLLRKQQEEMKHVHLLKLKEEAEELVNIQEKNMRMKNEKELKDDLDKEVIQEIVEELKKTNASDAKKIEEYDTKLNNKIKISKKTYEQKIKEIEDNIKNESKIKEDELKDAYEKKRIELMKQFEKKIELNPEIEQKNLNEKLHNLKLEEQNDREKLNIEIKIKKEKEKELEEERYEEQMVLLKKEHDQNYEDVVASIEVMKDKQKDKLEEKIKQRKRMNALKLQKQLEEQRNIELSKITNELTQTENNLKEIQREAELENGMADKKIQEVKLSKTDEEEIKAEEERKIKEKKEELERQFEEEQKRLLEEEEMELQKITEKRRELKEKQAGQEIEIIDQQHRDQLERYQENLDEEHLKQKEKLKQQMQIKRERKLLILKKQQQVEIEKIHKETEKEIETRLKPKRLDREKRRIEKDVANGLIEKGKVACLIDMILQERHDEELNKMLIRQYEDRVEKLKETIRQFSDKKISTSIEKINEWKREGKSQQEMEQLLDKLGDELRKEQKTYEEESLQQIRQQHENEYFELNQQQIDERTKLYHELVPSEHLEEVMKEAAKNMKEYQEELQLEKERRINEMTEENIRRQQEILKEQELEKIKLEEQYKKELEEVTRSTELKIKEQEAKRKMEEQQAFAKKLESMATFDTAVREQIMKEHDENLNRLEGRIHEDFKLQQELIIQKKQHRKDERFKKIEKEKQKQLQIRLDEEKRALELIQQKLKEEKRIQEMQQKQLERADHLERTYKLLRSIMKQRRKFLDAGRGETLSNLEKERKAMRRNQLLSTEEEKITPDIVKRLLNIEKLLNDYNEGELNKDKNISNYIELPKDNYHTEGKLEVVDPSHYTELDTNLLEFGEQILKTIEQTFSTELLKQMVIQPAYQLPHNNYNENPFRNRFVYDEETNTLFLRYDCFKSPGEYLMVLLNVVSHLIDTPFNFATNLTSKYISIYFYCLKICYQLIFNNYKLTENTLHYKTAETTAEMLTDKMIENAAEYSDDDILEDFDILEKLENYESIKSNKQLYDFLTNL